MEVVNVKIFVHWKMELRALFDQEWLPASSKKILPFVHVMPRRDDQAIFVTCTDSSDQWTSSMIWMSPLLLQQAVSFSAQIIVVTMS